MYIFMNIYIHRYACNSVCIDHIYINSLSSSSLSSSPSYTGGDVISSAPYCDPDPIANIRIIFDLAKEFNCPVDFHLGIEFM
jgi:hypothetical protein